MVKVGARSENKSKYAQEDEGRKEFSALRKEMMQLSSILSAYIVTDESGHISEVNVVANYEERTRPQIARDVVSLVAVRTGEHLSPQQVTAVFQAEGDLVNNGESRPQLKGFSVSYDEERFSISVAMQLAEKEVKGFHALPVTQPESRDLIRGGAEASLQAVNNLLAEDGKRFLVEDIALKNFAEEKVILVAVSVYPDNGAGTLVGTARIKRDVLDASARAALDAINRTFTLRL